MEYEKKVKQYKGREAGKSQRLTKLLRTVLKLLWVIEVFEDLMNGKDFLPRNNAQVLVPARQKDTVLSPRNHGKSSRNHVSFPDGSTLALEVPASLLPAHCCDADDRRHGGQSSHRILYLWAGQSEEMMHFLKAAAARLNCSLFH